MHSQRSQNPWDSKKPRGCESNKTNEIVAIKHFCALLTDEHDYEQLCVYVCSFIEEEFITSLDYIIDLQFKWQLHEAS